MSRPAEARPGLAPHPPRFDRIGRLVGQDALAKLASSHVVVVGLGGVGSFVVEALARSGVGRLTLVDGERVCETNVNRQLHAHAASVGRSKAEAMAERVRLINPDAELTVVPEHYGAENAERLLPASGADFVVDAIDTVTAKIHLLARCLQLGIPVVSCLGSASRLDSTAIQVSDLCESHTDQFARDVRKYLHARHGIDCTRPTGILAVWSRERPLPRRALPGDQAGIPGVRSREPGERRREPKCFGSAAFVTGVVGLAAAGAVIQRLTGVSPGERAESGRPADRARRRKR